MKVRLVNLICCVAHVIYGLLVVYQIKKPHDYKRNTYP